MAKNGIWLPDNTFKPLPSKPSTMVTGGELATRQNSPYNYTLMGFLPDPDPVLQKMGKSIAVLRELMSDPHVGSVVQQRKAGVLSMEWDIDRGKSKSRQAKLVKQMFEGQKMYQLTSNILDALFYGYQPIEVVPQIINGIWTPVKIEAKPQEWFSFNDENKLVLDFGNRMKRDPVPDMKFLLPRNNPSYLNPYGEKLLSRVFWSVTFKRGGLKFWVTFAEKFGMPQVIGKVPRGTGETLMNDLRDKLEDMVQDAVAVIFDDQSIDIKNEGATTASPDIYKGLVDFCNAEISKAILTQTLTTQSDGAGSYALGKEQGNQLSKVSKGDVEIVTETYQELINWFDFNNSRSAEVPKFIMYQEEDVDDALAKRDTELSNQGVKFTKTYYKKSYGLEDEDFELGTATPPADTVKPNKVSKFADLTDPLKFKAAETQTFPDQEAIDKLIDSFSNEDQQTLIEPIVKKLMAVIAGCSGFDEALEKLSGLYPEMNDSGIEKLVEKLLFIAEVFGRLNADQ